MMHYYKNLVTMMVVCFVCYTKVEALQQKQKKDATSAVLQTGRKKNVVSQRSNLRSLGKIRSSTPTEVAAAIAAARAAQPGWQGLGFKRRIAFLENLYQAFERNRDQIASLTSQQMGMPITFADTIDVGIGLAYMRCYLDNAEQWLAPDIIFEDAQEAHYLFFEPKGVVGNSIPWNYPFCNFIWSTIQNIVLGNTVVFKHSEKCPHMGTLLDEIIVAAGLPQGVCRAVHGDGRVGEVLMNGPIDLIFFTGSTQVGKHLYKVAAEKFIPATLELGGSAPGIVFEDVDLSVAIESIYFNRFGNSGQRCDGLKRLLVHKSRFDEVVAALQKTLATKKIGDPLDRATEIGPLVDKRQLNLLQDQVADARAKGAQVVAGGKQPQGLRGAYYEPTLLINISSTMRVWKEEVFGPVLPIVAFETEDEAIELANDTQYGLGGYIYTQDTSRAMRVSRALKTGNICINGAIYKAGYDTFGGYKNSGIGREHGKHGMRELCSAKSVVLKK